MPHDVISLNQSIERMKRITALGLLLMFIAAPVLAQSPLQADPETAFKQHVQHAVSAVKATDNPVEKRQHLDRAFDKLDHVLGRIESMNRLSEDEQVAAQEFRHDVAELKAELNGTDGFDRVADGDLNAFADYAQQSLEQAARTLTITLTTTTILLIILIVLLLA